MNPHGDAAPARVRSRPAGPADEPFLRALFRATRTAELAALGGSPAAEALIDMQYDFQQRAYRSRYPSSNCQVVERIEAGADAAVPVGRLWVDVGPVALHLLDITLLPAHRGSGIGGALLRELLAQAARAGLSMRLHVERTNPARRLYERLGFAVEDEHGLHLSMRRDDVPPTIALTRENAHHEQA